MERGWWSLEIVEIKELSDDDREHIASMIKQGFEAGEIYHEDNSDNEED